MARRLRCLSVGICVFTLVMIVISVFSACFAKDVGEVKIGAIYPLTGATATVGVRSKNAVELALDIINNKCDLDLPFARTQGIPALNGAKLRVVFADSQGSPETGMAEAERLITSEKVCALMGCFQSSVTKTASQAAERFATPFLNADAISPELAQRGFKWYWQTTPDANTFVQNWFKFLNELGERNGLDMKSMRIGLLYENTDAGVDTARAQERYAAEYGYNIAAKIAYPHQASDLSSEVMKLKSEKIDIVMQVSYTPDAILFTKTMKEMNYNPKAVLAWDSGHTDPAYLEGVGEDGYYLFVGDVWSLAVSSRKPIVKEVNDMYFERYGANMDASSARAFTGVFVLADAIERAGSLDKSKISKALWETDISGDSIVMAWSGINFDPSDGRNTLAGNVITQIQGGEYEIVWPFELAERDFVWPMPAWEER